MRVLGVLVFCALPLTAAQSGPLTEEMSQCFVSATTAQERELVLQNFVFAFASHPSFSDNFTISKISHLRTQKKMGDLMEDLILVRCRTQAKNAVKLEGETAFGESVGALAKAAHREMDTDPRVNEAMRGYIGFIDQRAIDKMLSE